MTKATPLRLVNATIEPILRRTSHDFEKGSITEIVAGSAWSCVLLLEAFLGMCALDNGSVTLLGENIRDLPGGKLHWLRSRVGVYLCEGGLISNLNAVENVILPLLYHSAESADVITQKALRALNRAGYNDNPYLPPGRLSEFQRAAVGLARVLAADPEVVFYDRLGDGLPEADRKALLRPALDFHRENPDRITVFLFPHPVAISGDAPVTVLNLSEGRFE